jgi:hypothetical protein
MLSLIKQASNDQVSMAGLPPGRGDKYIQICLLPLLLGSDGISQIQMIQTNLLNGARFFASAVHFYVFFKKLLTNA